MTVPVTRSPEAVRDVENIVQYFIEQNTPATAIKFAKSVSLESALLGHERNTAVGRETMADKGQHLHGSVAR
jgi:plasmid stabilization system protein ParE